MAVVVEDLVKEVKGGLKGRYKEVFDEGVAVEGDGWNHWKKEQNSWRKTTGALDL
ncbi:hypothetical protein PPACK8108_LOCUS12081 [Phakopsora pachyrhizi]|uniref:Uncharacterized protein n=1 Tax=Phakopsora pachyrhizi TaxID=170000 RepID=A0AAV0B4R5_PHAPC|nr:hypothetical protein PPACK8108_LOCUS12081 [Phakopsora pachyrhizi]